MRKLGPSLNTKSGKLLQMFPDFSGGLNTIGAVHQVAENEFVDGQNVDIDEMGSVSKRKGCTQLPIQPPGTVRGIYAFKTRTNRHFLAVSSGIFRKYNTGSANPDTLLVNGTWDTIPIRLYKPNKVKGVQNTTNSTLTASATYEYKVVAKDAVGMTLASDVWIEASANVSRVTLTATPKQIDLTWDKVLGATGYNIYRATVTAGVAGPFQLTKSVGNVATWTDTGADVPNPAIIPPVANTTSYVLIDQDATFVSWNDRLYFTVGNGLVVWDGINDAKIVAPYYPSDAEVSVSGTNAYTDATSSIHKCQFVKMFWNRLFLCGDSDYPQNVYFTDLGISPGGGEVAYFQGSYAFDVTTDNNESVTGVSNFRDSLVFFTRQSIHTLFGKQPDATKAENFTLRLTNNSVGCVSHKSIVTVHNSLVFVSMNGIYALVNVYASDTSMNVQYLSQKIEPTFRNLSGYDKCVAVFHNQQYKISFPNEQVVLRWYASRQAWTLDYTPTVSYTQYLLWNTKLYGASTSKVYRIDQKLNTDGVTEVDTYNDNGEAISFLFRTKSFDMRAMVNTKKFRNLFLMAKQYDVISTVHVEANIDYQTLPYDFNLNESTVLGTWQLGFSRLGWVDVIFQNRPCKAKGHQIYFVITNNVVNEPVSIYGLGLEYKVKPA